MTTLSNFLSISLSKDYDFLDFMLKDPVNEIERVQLYNTVTMIFNGGSSSLITTSSQSGTTTTTTTTTATTTTATTTSEITAAKKSNRHSLEERDVDRYKSSRQPDLPIRQLSMSGGKWQEQSKDSDDEEEGLVGIANAVDIKDINSSSSMVNNRQPSALTALYPSVLQFSMDLTNNLNLRQRAVFILKAFWGYHPTMVKPKEEDIRNWYMSTPLKISNANNMIITDLDKDVGLMEEIMTIIGPPIDHSQSDNTCLAIATHSSSSDEGDNIKTQRRLSSSGRDMVEIQGFSEITRAIFDNGIRMHKMNNYRLYKMNKYSKNLVWIDAESKTLFYSNQNSKDEAQRSKSNAICLTKDVLSIQIVGKYSRKVAIICGDRVSSMIGTPLSSLGERKKIVVFKIENMDEMRFNTAGFYGALMSLTDDYVRIRAHSTLYEGH
jgi:hypothetical protein